MCRAAGANSLPGGIREITESSIRLVSTLPIRYIPDFRPSAHAPSPPRSFVQINVSEGMVQQLPPGTRRLNSRVESGKSVWVYWECDRDRDVSRVANLSVGGLFIETPKKERVGAITKVHFLVPEGQIRADGVVRHVKPGGGLGLKFEAVSERDRPNLAALMRRLRSLA